MDTKDNNTLEIQLTVSDDLLNKVLRALMTPAPNPMGGGMPIPMSLLAGMLGDGGGKPEPKEGEETPTVGGKIKGAK